jgi:hypothetical protein
VFLFVIFDSLGLIGVSNPMTSAKIMNFSYDLYFVLNLINHFEFRSTSAEQLRAAGQLTWMVVDASKQLGDIDLNADTLASWYWLWWCQGTVLTFLEVRKNAPEQVRNAMLCTCADLLRSCIFIPCKLTKQRIMSSL